ncbi:MULTISPECIES: PRC-barrel domain-containing protein [unclassified Thioalkalivibrio]|uniref:PRC-barrel domain-containing protein n=1 Tax=unclassified Thioalkalivibrio TaxID=2621013 RepID=UPI00035FE434|nr:MULTISPECIES: PRC-barrel domain-containing protein [unclassified Thioalkalivibrio]
MNRFTSLKLATAMIPVLAFGIGNAMAAEHEMDTNDGNAMEEQAANDRNDAPHIDRMPAQGLHASDLMDKKVHSRDSDEEIGEINDLVIDQDGRIVAVVIGTGGVLGMGEKDVAIAWDRIDRSTENDEVKLYIDMDEDTLKEAPEYERD